MTARMGPEGSGAPGRLVRSLVLSLLALVTIAAFAGVLSNDWIGLDDPTYIVENPHVLAGWKLSGLVWFLHAPHGGNWHPITSYSHMLDVQLFGLNPGAHHAVNLLLHVANVLLLVIILHRMTGAWWRSVLVGVLFGLHPLRVESVAWAAERKDVLSMFFFLLTIESYCRWVQRPGALRYAAVMLLLALGLMSKPMLVTAPLLLMLLDLWPLGRVKGVSGSFHGAPRNPAAAPARSLAFLAREKWPLFLLAGLSAVATVIAQHASSAIISTGTSSLNHRLANAAVTYWRYIGMTLCPAHLVPFYPDAPVGVGLGTVCVTAFIVVTAAALSQFRRRPHLTVGWLWYVVALLPVIGLVQVGSQAYADRYTYLPIVGLLCALVWTNVPRRATTLALGVGFLAALPLFVLTRRQVTFWKDTRSLFTYALRVNPRNALAHLSLGLEDERQERNTDALREFEAGIQANPRMVALYACMGDVMRRLGRDADAVRYYEAVLRFNPDDVVMLRAEGAAMIGTGRLDDAVRIFRHALARDPNDVEALRQLGVLRGVQGDLGEALTLLRRAEALAPGDAYVQHVLAKTLALSGGPASEVVSHLRRAIDYKPAWAAPYATLALVLATSPDSSVRDTGEALAFAAKAVALSRRRDSVALAAEASALGAAGRFASAAATAREALGLAVAAKTDSLAAQIRESLRTYEGRAARAAVRSK